MKTLYFDCTAGISGDMTLAAMIDLGINPEQLIRELEKLNLSGWELKVSDTTKHGITAKHLHVLLPHKEHSHKGFHPFHRHNHSHQHRTMADIEKIISQSTLSNRAKELSNRIFMRLAIAEAKVHNTTPDKVHFHEVGAMDSIIDIVGTAICIDILSPDRILASTICDGHGFVNCQHGQIPVPVPAVVEVLAARGAKFKQHDIQGEMTTPTGAAIISELAESFGAIPEMSILKTGNGAGTKDFPIPNILRLVWGQTNQDTPSEQEEQIIAIETNIDDTTPEILGYTMEKLFEAGAKDVFFTPIYMKKNRPAVRLSIICDKSAVPAMEHILFVETSAIGLRKHPVERTRLPRKAVTISTPHGQVQAKETTYANHRRITVEYEDARRLAREKNIPLSEIMKHSGRQTE